MTAPSLRRGARAITDDAVDRIRAAPFTVALLHLLPSVPFFGAVLWWFVDIDLRGAMPPGGTIHLAFLVLPKMLGWGALAAWAAGAARGLELGVGEAWARAFTRLPEVLLGGACALLSFLFGCVSGVGFVGLSASFVGLAAGVARDGVGWRAMYRQGVGAAGGDVGRSLWMLVGAALAWAFLVVNIVVLPVGLLLFGAGSLGFDMRLVLGAMSPSRAATWAFAGLAASLAVEALLVVAFAELQADREAEREGARFEAFAQELEAGRTAGRAKEAAA